MIKDEMTRLVIDRTFCKVRYVKGIRIVQMV
jgi:hypothetical protein